MGYEKIFESSYPNGWKDIPDRTTPAYASTFNNYDEAIEHIENHLNGSSAVFPIQATGGMTQPVGIDEHGRLVTMPTGGGGGGSASEITYDNTESELESTDVQGAIDELAEAGGGGTAATTTYDNTESGLEATNVQDAIDEVNSKIGEGGSGYTEEVLFNTPTVPSVNQNIPLRRNIENFDEIYIVHGYTTTDSDQMQDSYLVSRLIDDRTVSFYGYGGQVDGWFLFHVDSTGDNLVIDGVSYTKIFKIVGIKYGGSEVDDIYSTEEIVTNKIWVDGKPIYRKVFTNLNVSFSTGQWNDTGVSTIQNIDEITYACPKGIDLTADYANNDIAFTASIIGVNSNTNHFHIYGGPNAGTLHKLVVEYTKTTD